MVNDPQVVALRAKVYATVDDGIHEDAVKLSALLRDGRRLEIGVDHAIGSLRNPLSDAQLEAKFAALVAPVLGDARSRELTAQWRTLASLTDIRRLTSLCRP